MAFRVRLAALLLIAIWTTLRIEPPTLFHYLFLIGLLAAVGYLQVPLARVRNRSGRLAQAAVIFFEMAILAYALIAPPPGAPPEWSMAMQFRLGSFGYVFMFIALAALTYSPGMAIWTAFSAVVVWGTAMLVALGEGNTYTIIDLSRFQAMDGATLRRTLLDPDYLSAVERVQEGLLAIVLATIVALACARARRLVQREIKSSAERANLARYFSPDLVEDLATRGTFGTAVARPEAAVLFADLVGFTRLSEKMAPEQVIELLREFHGRMARAVFAHGGTLHKFLGDGFMASFGVTAAGQGATQPPAALALDCLKDIHGVMATWNVERQGRGETPLTLAAGLHFGPVVAGDIGDARCLEFAILGDTVNVASRLESLCRPLEAAAVISEDVVAQVPGHPVLQAFQATAEATALRGRAEPVQVFKLPRDAHF